MATTVTDQIRGITISESVKAPVKTAATTNITLAALQTLNSIALVEGDRVLCVNQTSSVDNGIYEASTGTWQRAPDFDGNDDVVQGTIVLVSNDGGAGSIYEVTTDDPIVIGTSAIDFTLRYGSNNTIDRTAGEIAANVTPVNLSLQPGELYRLVVNTNPGTTDVVDGFQALLDSATDLYPVCYFTEEAGFSEPILLREAHINCLTIDGRGRVTSIVNPLAADIKVPAQNINCLFFNQKNAGNLHLKGFRCGPDVSSYTGIFLYCKENGGADASGEALFSAVIDDCWFSFSSNNSGIFRGGFSNLSVTKCVFESTKTACFRMEGLGNGDLMFIGNTMNGCYDPFLYGSDDTEIKANITINTLHAYQHMRGPLVDVKNGTALKFNNIHLQPDSANVGDCGLLKLTDCTDVQASNLTAMTRTGVPVAAVGIEIVGAGGTSSGTFIGIKTDATVGLRTSGTGTVDLTFIGCDFSGCTNGWQHLSGALGGVIRFIDCKFNNSLKYGLIVTAGGPSFNVIIEGASEILNAGMDTTTTARNLDIATSGSVYVGAGVQLGKNSGSAAADHFIRAEGSGTYYCHARIIGTPPTAIKTGSQTVEFIFPRGYGGTITSAATVTLPNIGDVFDVSGNTNIDTIVATAQEGRRITLAFASNPTITDAGNMLMAGSFTASGQDTISFVCIGANWYESGRSVN